MVGMEKDEVLIGEVVGRWGTEGDKGNMGVREKDGGWGNGRWLEDGEQKVIKGTDNDNDNEKQKGSECGR